MHPISTTAPSLPKGNYYRSFSNIHSLAFLLFSFAEKNVFWLYILELL